MARVSLTLFVLSALLSGVPAHAQEASEKQASPRGEIPSATVMSPAQVAAEAQTVITGLYRLQARIHHVSQIEQR